MNRAALIDVRKWIVQACDEEDGSRTWDVVRRDRHGDAVVGTFESRVQAREYATNMNANLKALLDEVWAIKAVCEDLERRKVSAPDAITIASVCRDLTRSRDRLVAVRDKRRRNVAPAEVAVTLTGVTRSDSPNWQAPLFDADATCGETK